MQRMTVTVDDELVAEIDHFMRSLVVIGIFMSWVISALIYRWNRYDELAFDPEPQRSVAPSFRGSQNSLQRDRA